MGRQKHRKWTPEEDAILISWTGSPSHLAVLLSRTYDSIKGRRNYLDPARRLRSAAREAEYRSRPEVKARLDNYNKAYRSRPEVKIKKAIYRSRPERKALDSEYRSRPEVRIKRSEHAARYGIEYRSRPEVKARKSKYISAYQAKRRHEASMQRYEHEMIQFFMKGPQHVNASNK